MKGQASVPRDVFPPTPPGPEGSNGNGLLRVQWVSGAWLSLSPELLIAGNLHLPVLARSSNDGNHSGAIAVKLTGRGSVSQSMKSRSRFAIGFAVQRHLADWSFARWCVQ